MSQLALFNRREEARAAHGYHGPFAELEARLLELILEERRIAPFAPLLVLLPTTRLVRYLKLRLLERTGALLNLHLHTFNSLIHALLPDIPRLGHPLSGSGRRLLASRVVQASMGPGTYFAGLKDHRGLPVSLLRVAAECERGGVNPIQLRQQAMREPEWRAGKLRDLANFMERYLERRDEGGSVDEVALERRAAQAAARWSIARNARALFLYGFDELTPAMEAIVQGLTRAGAPLRVFVPQHGPDALSEMQAALKAALEHHQLDVERLPHSADLPPTLGHLRENLFGPPMAMLRMTPEPDALQVWSAPDPASEVRTIARQVQTLRADGHPYENMLVAFRRGDPYGNLVEEIFTEYQIPFQLGLRIPLRTVPAVRAFRALLELIHSELPREGVMELFCSPYFNLGSYLNWQGRRQSDVFEWDRITREAGITRGVESWEAGFRRLRRTLAAEEEEDTRRSEVRIERVRRQTALLEHALADLRHDFARFPVRCAASAYSQLLADLLGRLIDGSAGEFGPGTPRDRAGLRQLQAIFAELSGLDRLAPELPWDEYRTLLEEELAEATIQQIDVEAGGVQVLDLPSIRGLSADFVFVGGLVEGVLPAREGNDPVLLTDERNRLNRQGARLEIADGSGLTEKVLFSLAVGAARRRLFLSLHRSDGSGRESLPSSYLREVWRTFFGLEVFDAGFRPPPGLHQEVRPDGAQAGAWQTAWELELIREARGTSTSMVENAIARDRLAAWLALQPPRRRSFEAEHLRWDLKLFTAFDGVLGPGWGPDPTQGVLSASRLERVGNCPFQYLSGTVWRLKPLTGPLGKRQVEAMPRGILYHRILFELLRRWRLPGAAMGPVDLNSEDAEREAIALVEAMLVEFEQANATGYHALWAEDRRQIIRDVVGFLRIELEAGNRYLPHSLEKSFGEDGEDSLPPLRMPMEGGRELSLRGRIDRIDLDPAQRKARVLDYKTGSARSTGEVKKMVERGLLVQLPIYLAAARALLPEGYTFEGFYYYYVTERRGGFQLRGLSAEQVEELEEQVQHALRVMGDILRQGTFFPWPDKDVCGHCDFRTICRRSPQARFERKTQDPMLHEFRTVRG